MWDVRACRGCLAVNCKLEKLSNACKRIFGAVTGLEIKDTDGFPKYFCTECLTQIKKSVAFRRKARRAHFVLQEIATIRKEISYKDIVAVDRVKTNLNSNLGYWKTTNREIYNIRSPELEDVTNEEESSNKYVKPKTYEPKFNRISTCQVIDIEPDSIYCKKDIVDKTLQEIQENLEKPLIAEEVVLENDIDNNSESRIREEFETKNIDINDVFKDLKEDSLSETEELQEKPVTYKKRNRKKIEQVHANPWIGSLSVSQQHQCVKALVNSKIEFQTVLQQSNNFAIRMLREPYFSSSFKCFICLLVFKDVDTLTLHAHLHNKWSKGCYKCNICRNKFLDSEELVMHLATNHWYKYTCNLCNITEYTLLDIMKHHSVHEEPKEDAVVYPSFISVNGLREYFNLKLLPQDELHKTIEMYADVCPIDICYDCNVRAKNLNKMEKNTNTNYKYHYQCDVCSQRFENMRSIVEHLNDWHTYQFECKTCSTVLYNRNQAHHHYMLHQPKKKPKSSPVKKKKEFNCLECNKTFAANKSLRLHMEKVHQGQWSEHCNLCGKPFMKSCKLYWHQLHVHKYISINHSITGLEQFLCKKCDIYFVNEKAYQYHLLIMNHEEAKDLPFACVSCKKLFENDEEFSKHTSTCKKFPKKCSYCEEMLMNWSEYKLHYLRQHPDLQYKHLVGSLCELCGKTVNYKMLKAHMQKHFASNTFQCRYCSLECSTATHLFIHIVSMHTHTPFLCGFCWKRHKNRKSCLDHILRVHAPIKPFKCQFCNKDYSDMKLFDQHSITIHGVKVNTKPITQVKKIKGKLYLYPNMKIDVSLVEESLFQNIEAELCDYLDEKSKPIQNIDNYIVRNQEFDSDNVFKCHIKKRKVTDTIVPNTKKRKIGDEKESVRNKKENFENNYETKVNEELGFEFDDSYIDTYGQMEVLLEGNTPQDMQVDETELEIIEKNGEEFVTLNGIMYKIEDSEVQ